MATVIIIIYEAQNCLKANIHQQTLAYIIDRSIDRGTTTEAESSYIPATTDKSR
jgi:penicillin V acylase-like amidase (Ntn superfamily)